eukprot:gene7753-5437_t
MASCFNPTSLAIHLQSADVALPGGVLSGQLIVQIISPCSCNCIKLWWYRRSHVVRTGLTRGDYQETTDTDEYKEVHFEKEFVLCRPTPPYPEAPPPPLLSFESPATFALPFAVRMPVDAPPSYHFPFVRSRGNMIGEAVLEWTLKAMVVSPYGPDAEEEKKIVLFPAVPRAMYDKMRCEPFSLGTFTMPMARKSGGSWSWCCCGKGGGDDVEEDIRIGIALLQRIVVLPCQGQYHSAVPARPPSIPPTCTDEALRRAAPSTCGELMVQLSVDNQTSHTLHELSVRLLQQLQGMGLGATQALASQSFTLVPPILPGTTAQAITVNLNVLGAFASDKFLHGAASPLPTLKTPLMETTTQLEVRFQEVEASSVMVGVPIVLTGAVDGENIVPGDLRFKA